ncbi:hypothetical protein ER308_18920 [Egibacter rhizosphaerae]|uniref:Cupin domain-containing protein n=1 Tax=Egibacter rhizosphaerae TaxID=1670831 RepID=A0A411YJR2_9ACTN|nr:hypothetical protein [Egibacter rhizosphaerae]QBI21436.1 hypothetical protein ER308_18920 [Egibacter rhizosphaerae]
MASTRRLSLFHDRIAATARAFPPARRVLYVAEGGLELDLPDRPGSVLDQGEAHHDTRPFSAAAHEGSALVLRWELGAPGQPPLEGEVLGADIEVGDDGDHLVRCDRVDFPPGGVAYLHTHQGPGIRCLLQGSLRVEVDGGVATHDPLDAWFEAGPDPVYAAASADEPTAFARVMVLPRTLLGQPSIRYVREEDRDKPKPQRYTMLVDEPMAL